MYIRPDPNGILSFLVSELDAAEKAGQKAWIFGHVPPGNGDAMLDQVRYTLFFLTLSGYSLLML